MKAKENQRKTKEIKENQRKSIENRGFDAWALDFGVASAEQKTVQKLFKKLDFTLDFIDSGAVAGLGSEFKELLKEIQ